MLCSFFVAQFLNRFSYIPYIFRRIERIQGFGIVFKYIFFSSYWVSPIDFFLAIPHGCPRAEPGSAFPYRYCTISGRYSLFSDRRMRQRNCHPFSFQRLDIALCSVSAALLSRVPSLVNPRLGTTCHELIVPCAAWLLSPSYCLCSSLYSIAALLSRPHDFL